MQKNIQKITICILLKRTESNNVSKHMLVYEGVIVKIGIINNNINVKLFTDKIIECWNLKRNALNKILRLNERVEVGMENKVLLKLTFGKLKITFKTIKLEVIKWYNLINQVTFA